jgi:conjugative relaxase-like TrwC/TraI family protein
MLRITPRDNADRAKSYYAVADYYTQGQEINGFWGGLGARRLGLEGLVDKQSFERLCDNLDPRTGGPLTVRTRSDRTVGYDFTFSVPKSVSLLYAMTEDQDLLAAFRGAVEETMRDIEGEMKTRVRRKGEDSDRVTRNALWAEFIHTTSRPVDGVPDAQLHAHCFVLNSTRDDKEGRWKAGQFRDLKRDAPYFQAAFRVRLANRLQDLGFGIERKRDDFEISGIPPSAIKRFSRRTDEIEKIAAELGITDPNKKAELGAQTRQKKAHELKWCELRQEWDKRLTEPERQALQETYRRESVHARQVDGERPAVDYALGHSFAREAVVADRKLLTEALKRGLGSVTVERTRRELSKRPLIRSNDSGRLLVATREMVSAEERLIALAREGRGRFRPLGDPDRPCARDWLNDGQKAAIRHVLGSRDLVTIVRGSAGTGKTTLEQELGEGLTTAGLPVVALAPTAEASRGVLRQEAGFATADTVARFLKDKEMQTSARGGVVLVDEASLLSTHDMLKLFDTARGVDARIVLVGDRKQHRSVSAGEPLKLLEEKAGLPVTEVKDILRQTGDYRKAAEALADGRIEEGFDQLDKLGWIREVADDQRNQALASAYLAAASEKKRGGEHKSALVVSPTHAEAARITASIRAALKAEGDLHQERSVAAWVPAHLTDAQKTDATNYDAGDLLQFHQNAPGQKNGSRLVLGTDQKPPVDYADRFEVYRPVQLNLAVGDRIRVTANGKTKEGKHRLSNGALFTVKAFTAQGDVVIDRGWVIGKDFGHLAHVYVVTSHASQGKTVDKVFIGLSDQSFAAASRRTFYVSATRAKEQAVIFTDNKRELFCAVKRPDEPMAATDLANQRKDAWRKRLAKILASVRRRLAFSRTHEPTPVQEPRKERDHEREISYAR